MKFKKNEASKLLLMMMATLAISVSAEQIEASSTRVMGTVVDPKGEVFEKLNIIQAPLTRLVIYRLPDQNSKNAAGVEINGHYHTSLQAGSYSELCLPAPTRPLISTRMAELEQVVKNDVDATKTLDLKPSQEVYLRVTERNDGSAKLDVVSADAAKVELKKTYLQLHAASRVPNAGACVTEIATQKQTGQSFKQVETMVIALDALFEFGKSDSQSILTSGRQTLDNVIQLLQNNYAKRDNVHFEILGYADPLGNPISNKHLSEARAKTIHDYLVAGGINDHKVSFEGRGSESLVVSDCARVITSQSIACNKPNRRVVLNVSTLTQ